MKNLASALLLVVSLAFVTSHLNAQTTSLADVSNACMSIMLKTGDVNASLGGVRPTGIDASVHPEMVTYVTEIGGYVSTAEAGIAASTNPVIAAYAGQLTAKYTTFATSTTYLCYCIATGDVVNANNVKSIVRDDFLALRALAGDIRGEIQKGGIPGAK